MNTWGHVQLYLCMLPCSITYYVKYQQDQPLQSGGSVYCIWQCAVCGVRKSTAAVLEMIHGHLKLPWGVTSHVSQYALLLLENHHPEKHEAQARRTDKIKSLKQNNCVRLFSFSVSKGEKRLPIDFVANTLSFCIFCTARVQDRSRLCLYQFLAGFLSKEESGFRKLNRSSRVRDIY